MNEELDYCGNFVYKNGSLTYIQTPEGRLVPNGAGFDREYFLTDHLGNTRVVFGKGSTGRATIVQEDHYYAFGMLINDQSFGNSSTPNTFLYNGKELESRTGNYQYGFRQYDPAIGRWNVHDAMAGKYFSHSPYAYCLDKPVNYIDPYGLDVDGYTTTDPTEISDLLNYFTSGGNVNSFLNSIENSGGNYNGYALLSDGSGGYTCKAGNASGGEMGLTFNWNKRATFWQNIRAFFNPNASGFNLFYRWDYNTQMPYNIAFLKAFIVLQFGEIHDKFNITLGMPKNTDNDTYEMNADGSWKWTHWNNLREKTVSDIEGRVQVDPNTQTGELKQTMYLSKAAFKSDLYLFYVTGHELVHIRQHAVGVPNEQTLLENGALMFNLHAAITFGDEVMIKMANNALAKYFVAPELNEKLRPYLYSNFIKIEFKPIIGQGTGPFFIYGAPK